MTTLELYAFVDSDDNQLEFTTSDANEAREYARTNGYAWIALQFEYSDEDLVEDYRPGHALTGEPL